MALAETNPFKATLSADVWARLKAVPTPALVLDLAALQANLSRMAKHARNHNIALRPHAKMHKSADIARMQLNQGAGGLCCAKLSEACALFEAGVQTSFLLTSPLIGGEALARLSQALSRGANISCTADHPDGVEGLARATPASKILDVWVDLDPGIHRTGVARPQDVLKLAQQIHATPGLRFAGVQFYCGLEQHIAPASSRAVALETRYAVLRAALGHLRDGGFENYAVSGGGTGSFADDIASGCFTELQVGSYAVLDRHYGACDLAPVAGEALLPALFVVARVISCNTPGIATVDAGLKAIAADSGPPSILHGPHAGAAFHFMGDEHGLIVSDAAPFTLGDIVLLQPGHCDPTVNLHTLYHAIDFSQPEAMFVWRVTARGCSQ